MSQDHLVTSSVDSQEHVSSKVFSSQDLYFTGRSRDSGVGQSVYQVLKKMCIMWISWINANKIDKLPEAERAPFYLSVQIPEKCTFGNDGTTKQNWQYLLRSLSLFKMLAWIKYTKCLNEVLRWASSPRETISCKLHKCSTNLISIWFQKVLYFYRSIVGTLKCWW